jgi:hypothetical protein
MIFGARCGTRPRVGKQQHPVRRHERLAHDDILAAGPGEAADEPVVDDLAIADRQQKEGALENLGRLGTWWRDEGPELDPARRVTAAGKRPGAAQHIAPIDRDGGAGRGKAGAGERVFVSAPDLALGLDREVGDRSAVRDRTIDRPAGRCAGRRDRQRDPERGLAVILEAAELPRPAGPQQLGVADLVDDVGQDVAIALGLFGECADLGHHAARPIDQLLGARNS